MKRRAGFAVPGPPAGRLVALVGSITGLVGACTGPSCPETICDSDGTITIVLTDGATNFAADLPYTVELCVAGSCTSYEFAMTGAGDPPSCENKSPGAEVCSVDGMGDIVVSALELPAGLEPGATVDVSALVTSADGTLLQNQSPVTVQGSTPGGASCPACTSASATFATQ